mmetsp:Transcript_42048/g.127522  ORF Transcript_42048/g.127522 Transcript_42048/m.127522 type:complete len:432 (-) Transcript_42048:895-2190(-)
MTAARPPSRPRALFPASFPLLLAWISALLLAHRADAVAVAALAFPTRGGIARDERVVFFPTAARRVVAAAPPVAAAEDEDEDEEGVDDGGDESSSSPSALSSSSTTCWEVPIHGWIFEPEERSLRRRAFVSLLRSSFQLDKGDEASEILARRIRPFLVDNERGKKLSIKIGGRVHQLPRSKANGHFRAVLRVDDSDLSEDDVDGAGRLSYEAITRKGDERTFAGESYLLEETGLSVVSDIDDTVKLSDVLDKKTLIRNTFLKEFESVPGMSDVYRRWADERNARFHFVSSSPWQLFEDLRSFLTEDGFPSLSTFHLKSVRLKDRTVLNLLKDPKENKVQVIESILSSYPKRTFVLVGDTGERDPEVYGEVARRYPNQVLRVFLRNVTGETKGSARFTKAFAGVSGSKWSLVGEDPAREMRLPPPDTCAPGI